MNYQKIYNDLIAKRQTFKLTKNKNAYDYQYCECHHIIPRCLNGSNDKSNLVNLTAREHFIAHVLLMKCHPTNISLATACQMMLIYSKLNPRNIKANSKKYDYIRQHISKIKSEQQKNLKWIKNTKHRITSFWPKDIPLSQQMIDDGWTFGRLPIDMHSNRTYENAGYKAGKFIRITNELEDRYILKDDPIPDGWHRGMSQKNRQHQSEACIGRPGTTTGKKMIINDITHEIKFISATETVPFGWKYGNKLKGIKRSDQVKQQISQSLKGKPMSDHAKQCLRESAKQFKWYTNGTISLRIKDGNAIPEGFKRGRVMSSKK